jgi:RNA polymerase sigma-70 factor (ECF subfamily)
MGLDDATVSDLSARIRGGDGAAYSELARRAGQRLGRLVRRLLADYPGVARYEQADDVLQNVHLRLWSALKACAPTSGQSLFNLAACLARRELTDLARRYGGRPAPQAGRPGADWDAAAPADPDLEQWTAFHEAVARLPDELREVIALAVYAGLPVAAVAVRQGVTERTVERRRAAAVVRLRVALADA